MSSALRETLDVMQAFDDKKLKICAKY
jgi:hypothetical protein